MAIMRVHKLRNYSIVSNQLLDNTVLSEGATLLLLRMLRKPDDWQFSVQKLAEEYGMNKNKVSRYFAELKEHIFLEITQVKTSKNFAYTYHVYEIPYDCYLDDEGRIRNRDTKQEIVLNHYTTSLQTDRTSHACAILGKYFSRHDGFLGTAQELIDDLPEEVQGEFTAKTLGKTLRAIEYTLEKNYDFVIEYKKTKHARLISVHYTDEESPFEMAEMLGDITDPQNEGTVLSPQNQRVTSPIPKTGIPEMGTIIITEYNNNKHKYVSDGTERMSDVTDVSHWTSDFASDLVWEEDSVDADASFTANSCQSVYVFDFNELLQDDMNSSADEDLSLCSTLDSIGNEDLSDVQSILDSRVVLKQSGMGTCYCDMWSDDDWNADAFNDDCSKTDYDSYSEDDFKDMEAFYEQSIAEWETHEDSLDGSEEEDVDWFIDRLPILKDTKHNPFVDLTNEDIERFHQEHLLFKKQREEDSQSMKKEGRGMSSPVEKLKRRKSSQVTKVSHESSMGSSQKEHQPNLSNTKQEDLESSLVNDQKDLVAYPKASSISKSESHSATEREAIQSLCNDLILHSTWNPYVNEGMSPLFTLRFKHSRGSPE